MRIPEKHSWYSPLLEEVYSSTILVMLQVLGTFYLKYLKLLEQLIFSIFVNCFFTFKLVKQYS